MINAEPKLNSIKAVTKVVIALAVAAIFTTLISIFIVPQVVRAGGDPNDPNNCTWSRPPFTSNGWLGRCAQKGYFTNNPGSNSYDQILSAGSPGDNDNALPFYTGDSEKFITYILDLLDNGNLQDKTGAAFIINTMLAKSGSAASRNIARADRSYWVESIRYMERNGSIDWEARESFYGRDGVKPSARTMNSQYDRAHKDDHFYGLIDDQTRNVIIFYDPSDGRAIYRLKKNCGNPIGTTQRKIPAPGWEYKLDPLQVDGVVPSGRTGNTPLAEVVQGQQFTIGSLIKNTETDKGDDYTHIIRPINEVNNEIMFANLEKVTPFAGDNGVSYPNPMGKKVSGRTGLDSGGDATLTAVYKAKDNAAAGRIMCWYGKAVPVNPVGDSYTSSNNERVCVKIISKERFDLAVTTTMPSVAQPGDKIKATFQACNSDDENTWFNTDSVLARGIAPGVNITSDGDIRFTNASNQTILANGCWKVEVDFTIPANAVAGQKYCGEITSSKNYGASDGSFTGGGEPSDEKCVIVGVSPYLQISGSDIWAGANFDTETIFPPANTCGTDNKDAKIKSVTSQLSGLWKGSLVEYAAFATGKVTSFGSNGSANSYLLTFANKDAPDLGEFTNNPRCIANYYGLLAEPNHTYAPANKTTSSNANINAFATNKQSFVDLGGTGTFSTAGEWKNIKDNRTIVINGNLYIANDIEFNTNYGGSATNNLNVPSLIFVVKGNILIDEDVSRVDALLISHKTIWTCASNATTPTEAVAKNICDKQLTINGALIANRVNFMRTREGGALKGGVNEASSQPAEIINFLPEFYLSKPIFLSDLITKDAFKTVLIKDLPPIY